MFIFDGRIGKVYIFYVICATLAILLDLISLVLCLYPLLIDLPPLISPGGRDSHHVRLKVNTILKRFIKKYIINHNLQQSYYSYSNGIFIY